MITADTVFTLSWTMLFEVLREKEHIAHSMTIDIYDHGWVCTMSWIMRAEIACKVRMTQSRTIESMITAETVLAWSWTMLYEIV